MQLEELPKEGLPKKVKGYRRLIPSMTALLVFEAAARLSSFTLAAQELGVTQAAVSKQIRFLEETLDTRLFHRLHRAIKLTSEGYLLFSVTSESLQRMASVFDRVHEGIREQEVVLASTSAFSQLRILPRLSALRLKQPNLQLRLVTQMLTPDLRSDDIDLAVRYGDGKWDDGTSIFLFDEEVFPVCSPGWLATHIAPVHAEDFLHVELIDSDATLEGWMTWQTWFKELGEERPKLKYALRCSSYTDTIQAALQGHGVALGWHRLLEPQLASGELVRLTEYVVRPKEAYYGVVPNGRKATPLVQGLVEWLCSGSSIEHIDSNITDDR
ncbi:LysR substrate-binding domain-containing protein [Pseudomonas sp. NPDC088444]|uniref:LysR substrate-binding domain-containing protein n=1 Tax=Pseudomonas sp. NPDC088444 TaxID=3364456 RepID=UPI00384C3A95